MKTKDIGLRRAPDQAAYARCQAGSVCGPGRYSPPESVREVEEYQSPDGSAAWHSARASCSWWSGARAG